MINKEVIKSIIATPDDILLMAFHNIYQKIDNDKRHEYEFNELRLVRTIWGLKFKAIDAMIGSRLVLVRMTYDVSLKDIELYTYTNGDDTVLQSCIGELIRELRTYKIANII